ETTAPEQPVVSRTEAPRTWSSQGLSTRTPSDCSTRKAGNSSKVHIPSSARTGAQASSRAAAAVSAVQSGFLILVPSRPRRDCCSTGGCDRSAPALPRINWERRGSGLIPAVLHLGAGRLMSLALATLV